MTISATDDIGHRGIEQHGTELRGNVQHGIVSSPSWAVCEILSLIYIWFATLTFRVTWCHRSRDHSFRGMWFPIGVPLTPTCYLELFARYCFKQYLGCELDLQGHVTSCELSQSIWFSRTGHSEQVNLLVPDFSRWRNPLHNRIHKPTMGINASIGLGGEVNHGKHIQDLRKGNLNRQGQLNTLRRLIGSRTSCPPCSCLYDIHTTSVISWSASSAQIVRYRWRIYLFSYLATFTRCGGSSARPPCVDQLQICDGQQDCKNAWDEDPETCGQFACWLIDFVLLTFSESHKYLVFHKTLTDKLLLNKCTETVNRVADVKLKV